jgi:outer membrane receptor protein involved in Fe transport
MRTPRSQAGQRRAARSGKPDRLLLECLFLIAWMAVSTTAATAQESGRISGEVVDAQTRAPVGQVQVFLQGTSYGTLTRQDGRFLMVNIPAGTYTLRAERIGMTSVSQEITVAAGAVVPVNFELRSQALGLDAIVVTGTAGASRQREIGNSIAQINTANLPSPPTQTTDMLKAAAAGVSVSAIGGELGQGQQIRLRGNGSVSMSNQPIIYIDGVRMQSKPFPYVLAPDGPGRGGNVVFNPLNTINPNDIERIEVIKGSAATTLYGTEASAGVIQIFTKKGSAGAAVWTAEVQQGVNWMRQFGPDSRPFMLMEPWMRNAHVQEYSTSVRGGNQNLQYFTSVQHVDEEGVQIIDEGRTWAARGNFTFTPSNDLQLQWNSSYSHRWQKNMAGSNNAHGITLNAMRGEIGYFGVYDIDLISQLLDYDIQTKIERFTLGGTATYSPLASLSNRFTVGYDFSQRAEDNLRPFGFALWPEGALYVTNWENRLLTFDYVGTYSHEVLAGLRTSFSWGGQAVSEDTHNYIGWARDFPGAKAPTLSSASQREAGESEQRIWNAGLFAQNVFDVGNRLFLTLGLRVDGNSAFGENFGLQMYPKASASWVASDEAWWRENWGTVKFRTAYGQSGRAPGAFDKVRTWTAAGWLGAPAFRPANVGNPDLGPEVTGEFEFGLDASWLGDRLSSTFTYYNQKTSDALFQVSQIPSEGFRTPQLKNVGELRNTGIELTVDGSPIATRNWRLDMGVNLTTNHSEVLSLGGAPAFTIGGNAWIVEGQPVPVIRGRVVTNPTEIAAPVIAQNHNYGPNLPTHTIGLTTTLQLPRGVSLSAKGDYRGGNYMVLGPGSNAVGRAGRWPTCLPYYVDGNPEPLRGLGVALKPDTPALWRARCTSALTNNEIWTHPADFFRLRNVSAMIPVDFLFPEKITNASLSLSLNDSWTWLKDFPFLDPEMSGNDGTSQVVGVTERLPSPISFRTSLRITF